MKRRDDAVPANELRGSKSALLRRRWHCCLIWVTETAACRTEADRIVWSFRGCVQRCASDLRACSWHVHRFAIKHSTLHPLPASPSFNGEPFSLLCTEVRKCEDAPRIAVKEGAYY